jgi:hypothetical protein
MKKVIILVGLFLAVGAHAESVEKAMMEDYIPVTDREFAFEVKTKVFEKVILDCGGFVGWMTFYNNGKIAHNVYMDTYSDCPNMHEYLTKAHDDKVPVCLQVEGIGDKSKLTVSNVPEDCQE